MIANGVRRQSGHNDQSKTSSQESTGNIHKLPASIQTINVKRQILFRQERSHHAKGVRLYSSAFHLLSFHCLQIASAHAPHIYNHVNIDALRPFISIILMISPYFLYRVLLSYFCRSAGSFFIIIFTYPLAYRQVLHCGDHCTVYERGLLGLRSR